MHGGVGLFPHLVVLLWLGWPISSRTETKPESASIASASVSRSWWRIGQVLILIHPSRLFIRFSLDSLLLSPRLAILPISTLGSAPLPNRERFLPSSRSHTRTRVVGDLFRILQGGPGRKGLGSVICTRRGGRDVAISPSCGLTVL